MKANDTLLLPPLVKQVDVACSQARAFTLFTAEIDAWWPLATHSLGRADAIRVTVESRVGGRIFELTKDGTEHEWGMVLEWSPPERVRFTWRVGHAANSRQEVDVRFEPIATGTRVTLTHSGFDLAEMRTRYDGGWESVLQRFSAVALR